MGTRSFQERVGDLVWGETDPSPEERKQLEQIRASVRAEARQAEEMYLAELDRVGAGRGVMAPPPKAEYQKFGQGKGEYRRSDAGGYDWYEGLAKKEQARLRDNGWFA